VTTPSVSEPVLIDSSGWLEYMTADTKADLFRRYFEGDFLLLVPTVVIYEVRKILLSRQRNALADQFHSAVSLRPVITFDERIALKAVALSLDHRLAMADAIVYASAEANGAMLVTSDVHFAGLPGVTVL
jgi:predicted nucleic acid-binding protein